MCLALSKRRMHLYERGYQLGMGVGNVHAISHALGGLYHIPHGQANAVLLPMVL